jgi:replicative DNA helicase
MRHRGVGAAEGAALVSSIHELRAPQAGRLPPHNLEAEESLLGAMMLSRDAVSAAVEAHIDTGDFYKPAHGHVFDAAYILFTRGEPVDPVTVSEELRRRGLLDQLGGRAELLRIQAATPASANAAHYAQIVGELALLRRLIAVAGDIAEIGYSTQDDVTGALDRAEQMVFEVAQRRVSDSMSRLHDVLEETMEQLEQLYGSDTHVVGVPTGYVGVDQLLLGLQPSQLIVLAARPGQGKCVTADTLVPDPRTGERVRADVLHARALAGERVVVAALGADGRVRPVVPSAFLDDGVRPVVEVTTALGRRVRATACHPFLTPAGWQPLEQLEPGARIAVPAYLPVQGSDEPAPSDVAVLAHLLGRGSGAATELVPAFGPVAADLCEHAGIAGLEAYEVEPGVYRVAGRGGRPKALRRLLDHFGVEEPREIPPSVERFAPDPLREFLRRFLAPSAVCRTDAPVPGITLALHSEHAAETVQHLLLRFGVVGARRAAKVEIDRPLAVCRFAAAVPLLGREEELRSVAAASRCGGLGPIHPCDTDPVWWDEIIDIDAAGEARVFDLTVPEVHNFVAADVFVHNTSFALGAATHVALTTAKPVLFFSMEMSNFELTRRLLAAEALVDARKLTTGRLAEADWPKVAQALGRLGEAKFFVDDNPHCTVMEMRAKARRMKARYGDLGLIVVDYLQLMSSSKSVENRQVEVSELSRGLKILARELEVPVMTLSQLNRQLEYRQDKRPMLADLRESGCLPASTVVTRADGERVTLGELHDHRVRDVEVLTLDEHYRLVPGHMTHVFATGVRPVHEVRLASGRRVRATSNHPFLTVGGWQPVAALRAGDRIAVPKRTADAPRDTIPAAVWERLERKGRLANGLHAHEVLARLAGPGQTVRLQRDGVGRALLRRIAADCGDELLDDLAHSPVHWDRVVAVRSAGCEPVFDATVEETHNFVADDVVVHNSIEQDADVVLFIYRDDYYNPDSDSKGMAEIIVAKHRNGPTGSTNLAFVEHLTKFGNLSPA